MLCQHLDGSDGGCRPPCITRHPERVVEPQFTSLSSGPPGTDDHTSGILEPSPTSVVVPGVVSDHNAVHLRRHWGHIEARMPANHARNGHVADLANPVASPLHFGGRQVPHSDLNFFTSAPNHRTAGRHRLNAIRLKRVTDL